LIAVLETDLIPYSATTLLDARVALVLAPHPDDEVFGCGGAISSHVHSGVKVHVLVLTDGALYGDAKVREHECIAAALVLGYGVPEFWQQPDRGLVCSEALVHRLVAKIAELGADLVYAPSPWEVHPDHRQAYLLAVAAVRQSGYPVRLALYEVGSAMRPNVLLNISLYADTKAAAMLCFASQLKQQNYLVHVKALNQYRTYTLGSDVKMAEAFWLTTPDELDTYLSSSLQSFISQGTLSKPTAESSATVLQSTASAFQRLKNWLAQVLN
jgi:LmbE family N-acetylglucosaminyl deacetylase